MDIQNAEEALKEMESQLNEESQQEEENALEELGMEEEVSEALEEDTTEVEEEVSEEHEEEVAEEVELPEAKSKQNKAFAEMRKQKKELETKLQEQAERLARLEGFQSAQAKTEVATEVEEVPDKDLYPDEYVDYRLKKQQEEMDAVKKANQQTQEQLKVQYEMRGVERLEQEYSSQEPSYNDAVTFLKNQEKEVLKLQHPQATDEQIEQHLETQKLDMFRQNPRGAAQALVAMAKTRGFSGKAPAPKKTNVQNLKKNIEKNANVMGGSNEGNSGELTSEQILDMSLEEASMLNPSAWDKATRR